MVWRIEYHPEAVEDFDGAVGWYLTRSRRVAEHFIQAISRAEQELLANPARHPRVDGEIRRIRVRPFPYSLIYIIQGDLIGILAVAHGRRRPGFWMDRSKSR